MSTTQKIILTAGLALVLAVASVVFGAVWLLEKRQAFARSAEVAELKATVARQQAQIRKSDAAAAESEQKRAQFAAKAKAARQSLQEARAAAADAASTPPETVAVADASDANGSGKKTKPSNPFNESIAKMMKDPAMKNMMRSGQSMALRQMYGDLVKQWSLTPEETNTFYDLLLDKQMAQMDEGMKALEKGSVAPGATPRADSDARIKESLGDDLYKQYKDYEKTLPAHMEVNQFQQQLALGNTSPLTPDQSKILLQTITEEQAAQPPGSYFSGTGVKANSFAMDTEHVDQMMKARSDLNAKIDARMANTLSPDQLQALKTQQEQTLNMQRMGMEMAAKMFASPSPTP